eukprot:TRINITY_DN25697_c0_g1_i1.p1 TRINITY_DN25697_c0_g1~~TRINITY_DN25697_c0_g1_i1.p1  ORF type:complete len:651 (+),score=94.47 TRINITY_DN25697_c0_g1_i1:43-1995(+)
MPAAVLRMRPSSPFATLAEHSLLSRPSSAVSNASSPNSRPGNASSPNSRPSVLESTPEQRLLANSCGTAYGGNSPLTEGQDALLDGTSHYDALLQAVEPAAPTGASVRSPSTTTRRRRAQGSMSGLKVNTVGCVGRSSKDLYSAVCEELGWPEVDVEPKPQTAKKDNTIFCVMQTNDMLERLPRIGRNSWVSRYIGCPDLCDKGNFARMCYAVKDFCDPHEFSFNPRTWVLPDQYNELKAKLEKSKKTFIVKPEDGSQGDGIFLVKGSRDLDIKLPNSRSAVVQQYVEKPLLLGGVKFDLRMYVCLIGGSDRTPPKVFLCKEGLARFCTEKYEEPMQSNMNKCMGHLTNYSLNKRSDKFEHAGETLESVFDPASTASKRPLTAALTQMERECPGFERDSFYENVASLVQKSVALMAPVLAAFARPITGGGEMPSFQILGFDVLLGHDFMAYLLEINNSPSLCIDEALPLNVDDLSPKELSTPVGLTREKGKVCRCMDMAHPHFHQQALVDVVVKKTAMGGAFQLLQQLKEGTEEPEHQDFIAVDVTGDPVFELLRSVENRFHDCGGAQKAFTSGSLRKHLGHLCSNGALEKHDLDTLSQKFRFTNLRSRDSARPEAMRLFDFLELLRQAGARAFRGAAPMDALGRMLQPA